MRGLKQGNKADTRGKGTTRARRLQAQIEKMRRRTNATNVQVQGAGRAALEPVCRWHLTSDDMTSVADSVTLPPGISQKLRTCSMDTVCTYKHTKEGSSLNRRRYIATRKRLLLSSQTQTCATAATPTSVHGILREFDFKKGYGWITPSKLAKGATARRQRVFFHISEWKCVNAFPSTLP